MLIAHVADPHITEHPAEGAASLEEQMEGLLWIGNNAAEAGAEVLLCSGDIFDGATIGRERNAALLVLRAWAMHMQVVVAYGNHDKPQDLDYLAYLNTKHRIHVFSGPGFVEIGGALVGAIPWPCQAWLAPKVPAGESLAALAVQVMRNTLLGFAARFAEHSGPRILMGHTELGGAVMDNEQTMSGKAYVELSEHDLVDTGADYIALGHIHKHQILGEGRICYAGAPRPIRFGEEGPKGYCLAEVTKGATPVITHREAPGRALVTIQAEWDSANSELRVPKFGPLREFGLDEVDAPGGCSLRLKYEISEANRAQAAEQAARAKKVWLASGARYVKIAAEVKSQHRPRSEAVAKAQTTADKLKALWKATGQTPPRSDKILEKLAQLESEVAT